MQTIPCAMCGTNTEGTQNQVGSTVALCPECFDGGKPMWMRETALRIERTGINTYEASTLYAMNVPAPEGVCARCQKRWTGKRGTDDQPICSYCLEGQGPNE